MWTAIVIAVVYAMALATPTVWGSLAPQWLQVMLEQRDRFLTLGAAIFGILSIVEPSHVMPKAYLATVIAGGLTAYAAVLNSFNPITLGVAGGILLATFPVFLLLTTTWRMPRRWEWAGWPAIASIVTLVAVVATINTPLAVLIVAILGEEIAFAALASAVIIAVFVLFVSCSTFAVKGVGRAQKIFTERFLHNQASGRRRGRPA